jgi:hypothetical protein
MKVYLDDERTTPEGWTRVYWPSEAIELLQTGQVTELSLDHDLGNDARGTGYDVVLWVEEQVAMHGFVNRLGDPISFRRVAFLVLLVTSLIGLKLTPSQAYSIKWYA